MSSADLATLLRLFQTPSAPAGAPRPICLSDFDGTTDYGQHRTTAQILLNRSSDEVKLLALVSCLRGEAQHLLHTLAAAARATYDAVDEALLVEYG